MTEALPSFSWRPAPPPPPEAPYLNLSASLTLPTLPATPPKSATPNQGLPTSTSSEPPQRPALAPATTCPLPDTTNSSPTSAPSMLYGQPCCQHLHRQLLSTHQSMLRGQYHRWRQRLGPHRRQKPNNFVHGPNLKTLAKLATVLVGECVNTIALSLITGTSALSLITSYTGPFLRRLPSSQPSWWGNVLIPGLFPFDLSPVSSGPLAHYK